MFQTESTVNAEALRQEQVLESGVARRPVWLERDEGGRQWQELSERSQNFQPRAWAHPDQIGPEAYSEAIAVEQSSTLPCSDGGAGGSAPTCSLRTSLGLERVQLGCGEFYT